MDGIPPLRENDVIVWKASVGWSRGRVAMADDGKGRLRVQPHPFGNHSFYIAQKSVFGVRCPVCGVGDEIPDRESIEGWVTKIAELPPRLPESILCLYTCPDGHTMVR